MKGTSSLGRHRGGMTLRSLEMWDMGLFRGGPELCIQERPERLRRHINSHIRVRGWPINKKDNHHHHLTPSHHPVTRYLKSRSCSLFYSISGTCYHVSLVGSTVNNPSRLPSAKMQITAIAAAMVAAASVVSADTLTILVIHRAHDPTPCHVLIRSTSLATTRSQRLHGAHQRHLALQQRLAAQHPRQHWLLGQPGARRRRHLLRLEQQARPLLWRPRAEPQALLRRVERALYRVVLPGRYLLDSPVARSSLHLVDGWFPEECGYRLIHCRWGGVTSRVSCVYISVLVSFTGMWNQILRCATWHGR